MTSAQLRKEIKKIVDHLPPERLESLADYVHFLDRTPLARRIDEAEKAIKAGGGMNWRKVRSDV
jgi:hypothetical protein